MHDFNKNYVLIRSGVVEQRIVIKNNEGTFLFEKILEPINKSINHMNTKKMYDLFDELLSNKSKEKTYAIDMDGILLRSVSKEEAKKKLDEFMMYLKKKRIPYEYDGYNLTWNGEVDKDIIPNTNIPINKPIFIIKLNRENIDIKLFEATYIESNFVKVSISDIPVKPLTLDVISIMLSETTKKLKEPTFCKKTKQHRKSFFRNRY